MNLNRLFGIDSPLYPYNGMLHAERAAVSLNRVSLNVVVVVSVTYPPALSRPVS